MLFRERLLKLFQNIAPHGPFAEIGISIDMAEFPNVHTWRFPLPREKTGSFQGYERIVFAFRNLHYMILWGLDIEIRNNRILYDGDAMDVVRADGSPG